MITDAQRLEWAEAHIKRLQELNDRLMYKSRPRIDWTDGLDPELRANVPEPLELPYTVVCEMVIARPQWPKLCLRAGVSEDLLFAPDFGRQVWDEHMRRMREEMAHHIQQRYHPWSVT